MNVFTALGHMLMASAERWVDNQSAGVSSRILILRVVHKIITQRYLKNADGVHTSFSKKIGNLIKSLKEKNSHEN